MWRGTWTDKNSFLLLVQNRSASDGVFFFFPRASLPLLPLHFQQETLPPLQGPLGSLLTLQNNVPNWELVSAFISISKLTCPASHPLGVCLIATSSRTNSSRAASAQRNSRKEAAGLPGASSWVWLCGGCAVPGSLRPFAEQTHSSRS